MNKRGLGFLELFVTVTLVLFVVLAFAMVNHNNEREKKYVEAVGYGSIALVKVYDEGAGASLYVERSVQYAALAARKSLDANGGYASGECKKSKSGLLIWSSCASFDPEKNFSKEFQLVLKKYLENYHSSYCPFEETFALKNRKRDLGLLPAELGAGLVKEYSDSVRNEKVSKIEQSEDPKKSLVFFEPLNLRVEYFSKDSVYTIDPKVMMPKQDFNVYQEVYNQLFSCVGGKQSFEECSSVVSNKLPGIKFKKQDDLVGVEYGSVKFALDPRVQLPLWERIELVS